MTEFLRIFSYFVRSCWKSVMIEAGMWIVAICIYFLADVMMSVDGSETLTHDLSSSAGFLAFGVAIGSAITMIGFAKNCLETPIGFFRPLSAMIAGFMISAISNVSNTAFKDNTREGVLVFGIVTMILCATVFVGSIIKTLVELVHLASKWVNEESRVGEDHR